MLMLYYFRWAGTPKELHEYVGRVKGVSDVVEGANFMGVFAPTSEWNAVILLETTSMDKGQEVYVTLLKKYGPNPNDTLAKIEILATFDELGYT